MALSALLLLAWLAPDRAKAAGLDCAKAATAVEKTICADPALRAGDAAMAETFADLLGAVPEADKPAVRAQQREWLASRNACSDATCLAARQAERLAALQAAMAATRQRYLDARAKLRARLGWPPSCEAAYQEMVSPEGMGATVRSTGVDAYALSGGRTLYVVQCDQAAYQATYTAVLTEQPDGPGMPLRFPALADSAAPSPPVPQDELVGDVSFDAAKGTLTVLTKARGLADCGSLAVYAFPSGARVSLAEMRVRECPRQPKGYVPPERWPLLRSR
ncbi:MAG: DUF1176 domain-containing protein [Solidesulfovibrio sp. DCME]|uniref:DUF1176 domain-containing protein n=1 Tax=Solidesulfovibrio sp. DCME TaxID=3447380 RepID=UPI003D0998E4